MEEKIKEFYNKRIKILGEKEFDSNINEKDVSGKMIFEFLKDKIKGKNKRILDAGCGDCRFSRYFIENGYKIICMDFAEENLRIAKKNIGKGNFVVGSVMKIPFEDKYFDFIFTVDVFQHVQDLKKAIREFHRVLKKDGILIIIDKNKLGIHSKYFIPQKLIKFHKDKTRLKYSGFKERWFYPNEIKRLTNNLFSQSEHRYLIEKNKSKIFHLFPQLNLFMAWVAKK